MALATVALIAVGALALLHGRRAPTQTASQTQPAPAAQSAAWTRVLSCAPPHLPLASMIVAPAMSNAAPDPRLLAVLGVLRRPWTSADAASATASCQDVSVPFPAATFNVRYVRYVGPAVRGGNVFLVPARGIALPPLPISVKGSPLARALRPHPPLACLITIGARSPGSDRCMPLAEIERPVASTTVINEPSRFALGVLRRICSSLAVRQHATGTVRARCLKPFRPFGAQALPPQVMSAVVRDGIVTVDVYAGTGRARKPVLTGVRVRDNVFSFTSGGDVTGVLNLVFKDSRGRVIPSLPVRVGALSAPVSAPSPPPSFASPRTAAPRRR